MCCRIVIIRHSMRIPLLEDDNLTKGWAKREKGTTIVDSSAVAKNRLAAPIPSL